MPRKASEPRAVKSSMYLPKEYLDAIQLIREKEKVLQSHQIEIGLRMYFSRHRKLLEANGIFLWGSSE